MSEHVHITRRGSINVDFGNAASGNPAPAPRTASAPPPPAPAASKSLQTPQPLPSSSSSSTTESVPYAGLAGLSASALSALGRAAEQSVTSSSPAAGTIVTPSASARAAALPKDPSALAPRAVGSFLSNLSTTGAARIAGRVSALERAQALLARSRENNRLILGGTGSMGTTHGAALSSPSSLSAAASVTMPMSTATSMTSTYAAIATAQTSLAARARLQQTRDRVTSGDIKRRSQILGLEAEVKVMAQRATSSEAKLFQAREKIARQDEALARERNATAAVVARVRAEAEGHRAEAGRLTRELGQLRTRQDQQQQQAMQLMRRLEQAMQQTAEAAARQAHATGEAETRAAKEEEKARAVERQLELSKAAVAELREALEAANGRSRAADRALASSLSSPSGGGRGGDAAGSSGEPDAVDTETKEALTVSFNALLQDAEDRAATASSAMVKRMAATEAELREAKATHADLVAALGRAEETVAFEKAARAKMKKELDIAGQASEALVEQLRAEADAHGRTRATAHAREREREEADKERRAREAEQDEVGDDADAHAVVADLRKKNALFKERLEAAHKELDDAETLFTNMLNNSNDKLQHASSGLVEFKGLLDDAHLTIDVTRHELAKVQAERAQVSAALKEERTKSKQVEEMLSVKDVELHAWKERCRQAEEGFQKGDYERPKRRKKTIVRADAVKVRSDGWVEISESDRLEPGEAAENDQFEYSGNGDGGPADTGEGEESVDDVLRRKPIGDRNRRMTSASTVTVHEHVHVDHNGTIVVEFDEEEVTEPSTSSAEPLAPPMRLPSARSINFRP